MNRGRENKHNAVLLLSYYITVLLHIYTAKKLIETNLTASNLTTVSIFRIEGSVPILTMMSPAGRERVREEMLGEERGCVPPLVRTM